MKTLFAALLSAVSAASCVSAASTGATRSEDVGAPTGADGVSGTPLPGAGGVRTPNRTTFDNVLNSGSSTGSSAASGATQATTCRPGAIVC